MKKAAVHYTLGSKHKRISSSRFASRNDITVSSRGYLVDSSEIRLRIQEIEKELIETRTRLYGSASRPARSKKN